MPQTPDDLDAVRTIVKTLERFEPSEQERILRWAREKIGLSPRSTTQELSSSLTAESESQPPLKSTINIKEFLNSKQPKSDNHLAATVAYYYRFEAPESERKEAITKEDLLNACRLADWERPNHPAQVLVNSQGAGLLNKGAEKGSYIINSVGENLVAVALPAGVKPRTPKKVNKRRKK